MRKKGMASKTNKFKPMRARRRRKYINSSIVQLTPDLVLNLQHHGAENVVAGGFIKLKNTCSSRKSSYSWWLT
jgi:hypothetical protein